MRFAGAFSANEIDFETLLMLEPSDLVDMGIKQTGPQKKLLKAIDELKDSIERGSGRSGGRGSSAPKFNPNAPEYVNILHLKVFTLE